MSTRADIPALTGLRGLAALSVVTSHYSTACAPFLRAEMPSFLDPIFGTAFIGMTLFFVLSGFVMTYHYADLEWESAPIRVSGQFFGLRLARICPVFGLALLVYWLQTRSNPAIGPHFGTMFALHVFSLETIVPVRIDGVRPDSFGVYWSIGTEIILYLVFAAALVLWNLASWLRPMLLTFGAAYLVAIFGVMESPAALLRLHDIVPMPFEPMEVGEFRYWLFYLSPFYRVVEFGFGCFAALYLTRWARPEVDRAISIAAVLAFWLGIVFWIKWREQGPAGRIEYVLLAVSFAMMMATSSTKTRLNAFLSVSPLIFVGTISLSVYIFQGTIASWVPMQKGLHFAWDLFPQFIGNLALSLLLLICFSFGTYSLVEAPARRLLRRLLSIAIVSPAPERPVPT